MSVPNFDAGAENPEEIQQTEPAYESNEQHGSEEPPWAEYLNDIPDGYKGLVSDAFKRWDGNVTQKISKIHEQYKPLKAYEKFAQSNIDPAVAEAGVALFNRLQSDPQGFYEQLGEHFGLSAQQVQETLEGSEDDEENPEGYVQYEDPRVSQLEQQQQQMMMLWQQQEQQRIEQEADQEIEQELAEFRAKYPEVTDTDMTPILRIAYLNAQQNPNFSFEDAYKTYSREIGARMQNRPGNNAPRVISPNGTPGSQPTPDFADLNEEDRKRVMVEELKRLNQT